MKNETFFVVVYKLKRAYGHYKARVNFADNATRVRIQIQQMLIYEMSFKNIAKWTRSTLSCAQDKN